MYLKDDINPPKLTYVICHKMQCSLYPLALFSSVLITTIICKLLLPELLSLTHYLFIQPFVCLTTSSAHHNLNILCHSLCIPWLIVCTSKYLSAYSYILSATQNNPYMHSTLSICHLEPDHLR